MKQKHKIPVLLDVGVIINKSAGVPCIELRRRVYEKEVMKVLVENAIAGRPVIILPVFKNRLKSLSGLVESGLMSYEPEEGAYYFTI